MTNNMLECLAFSGQIIARHYETSNLKSNQMGRYITHFYSLFDMHFFSWGFIKPLQSV